MRCPTCPLAPGAPCRGQIAARLCELVDPGHPDYRPEYLSLLAPGGATPAPAALPAVAETVALIARAKACPYRSAWPACGCSGARCALRGGAVVAYPDCFECLKSYG